MKLLLAILLMLSASAAAADGDRVRVCDKTDSTRCASVDASGAISTVGGAASTSTAVNDGTVTTQKLGVNASGQAAIQNPPNLDAAISTRAGDRTTAAAPFSVRQSDGAAFIDPRDVSDRAGRLLGILSTGTNVIGGVTQSGTWTVQPGNTANTTAWKVDASSTTVPISVASLPLPLGAASDATVAETHAVSLGSIPTRQDMIAGSDYGYTCNNGACSQIPRFDANGNQYTAVTNIARVQIVQSVNPLLQRCNAVRRVTCQP